MYCVLVGGYGPWDAQRAKATLRYEVSILLMSLRSISSRKSTWQLKKGRANIVVSCLSKRRLQSWDNSCKNCSSPSSSLSPLLSLSPLGTRANSYRTLLADCSSPFFLQFRGHSNAKSASHIPFIRIFLPDPSILTPCPSSILVTHWLKQLSSRLSASSILVQAFFFSLLLRDRDWYACCCCVCLMALHSSAFCFSSVAFGPRNSARFYTQQTGRPAGFSCQPLPSVARLSLQGTVPVQFLSFYIYSFYRVDGVLWFTFFLVFLGLWVHGRSWYNCLHKNYNVRVKDNTLI